MIGWVDRKRNFTDLQGIKRERGVWTHLFQGVWNWPAISLVEWGKIYHGKISLGRSLS